MSAAEYVQKQMQPSSWTNDERNGLELGSDVVDKPIDELDDFGEDIGDVVDQVPSFELTPRGQLMAQGRIHDGVDKLESLDATITASDSRRADRRVSSVERGENSDESGLHLCLS